MEIPRGILQHIFFKKTKKENSARVLISGAPYSAVPSALDVSARVLSLAIWEECLGSRAHQKRIESRSPEMSTRAQTFRKIIRNKHAITDDRRYHKK